jgi:hypothetical protein
MQHNEQNEITHKHLCLKQNLNTMCQVHTVLLMCIHLHNTEIKFSDYEGLD